MLLGVEHIQFCVRDLAAARAYLEGAGYRSVFELPGFDRNAPKLPRYRGHGRSMVYLRGAGSAVELIDGEDQAGTPGYVPLLPSALLPPGVDTDDDTFRVDPIDTECGRAVAEGGLNELRLGTSRLADSLRFWQALGGRLEPVTADGGAATVAFAARIATMPLRLTLNESASRPAAESFVDELGCRLVALLSTALEDDLERIAEAGGRPSEVRALEIHGRTLRISFVVAPSGEIVEIIEAGR